MEFKNDKIEEKGQSLRGKGGGNMKRLIIIYGAGEYGKRMLHFLRSINVRVDYFCQTDTTPGLYLEDIPVMSFFELLSLKQKMIIFIAIGDNDVSKKIKLQLTGALLDQADVRRCGDFLDRDSIVDEKDSRRYCLLCNSLIDDFLAGGYVEVDKVRIFQKHHIIGAGKRDAFQCPVCGGIDRERWLLWVMAKNTNIFREKCRVLHFAPEAHLSKFIAANPYCEYYTGDIISGRAMHQTDITDIQYKDETFDYVIMNHVLEHIEDMGKAMSEIKRVLKPEGEIVLSFPICTDQETNEIPEITSPAERLQYYGQEDHVRLFGRDYLDVISSFGLDITVYTPKKFLCNGDIKRYGFIEDDVLMICRKE